MSQCPKIILYICTKQINFLRYFRTPSLSWYSFSDPQMTRVARLCIDSILLMCLFLAITKWRARLGQTALWDCFGNAIASFIGYYKVSCAQDWVSVVSNCTMGLFWERYRFFYSLLRSCAGNWVGVLPNQHHGIVVGTLSLLLRPLKRFPQRLSLKHNLQIAKTERPKKGIDEHISPQKKYPKSDW